MANFLDTVDIITHDGKRVRATVMTPSGTGYRTVFRSESGELAEVTADQYDRIEVVKSSQSKPSTDLDGYCTRSGVRQNLSVGEEIAREHHCQCGRDLRVRPVRGRDGGSPQATLPRHKPATT